jgi:hypothetical protein
MRDRPGLLPELIIPVLSVAFAIYYLSTVWSLPFQAKVVGIACSGAIGVLTILLIIRFAGEVARGEKGMDFRGFFSTRAYEVKRWGVLAATILFIALMPVLGFTVTLFAYILTVVLLIAGMVRLKAALITATSLTAIAFVVFILLTNTRFPLTAVDTFLRGLVI